MKKDAQVLNHLNTLQKEIQESEARIVALKKAITEETQNIERTKAFIDGMIWCTSEDTLNVREIVRGSYSNPDILI
jgi:hypothetical protein